MMHVLIVVLFLTYCLLCFQESLLLSCNYVITKSYSQSKQCYIVPMQCILPLCVCVCAHADKVYCRIFVFTVMRLNHGRLDGCLDYSVSLHVHQSFMPSPALDFLSFSPPLCSGSQSCHAFENAQVPLLRFPGKRRGHGERHGDKYYNCLVFSNQLTA